MELGVDCGKIFSESSRGDSDYEVVIIGKRWSSIELAVTIR